MSVGSTAMLLDTANAWTVAEINRRYIRRRRARANDEYAEWVTMVSNVAKAHKSYNGGRVAGGMPAL